MTPTLNPYLLALKKFGPYVLIAILGILLFLSHAKTNSLETQLSASQTQVETITANRDFYRTALSQRDVLLMKQSGSIQALADAAKVNRDTYVAGIKQAQSVSADHAKAAGELLALTAPEGELSQCRSARQLLEDELTK